MGELDNFRSPGFIISIAVFIALGLASQFLTASRQPAVDGPKAKASDTTHTQTPTPSLGEVASNIGSATGDVMSEGKKPRDIIRLPGNPALAQPVQQSQASVSIQPVPTAAPARRPLFGR